MAELKLGPPGSEKFQLGQRRQFWKLANVIEKPSTLAISAIPL
jgi:hypothetical protein